MASDSVPVAYAELLLRLAQERGVARERMLEGLDIPPSLLAQADGRVAGLEIGRLLLRALAYSKDAGLGYEIGLRSGLSSHGFVGYGLLSQATFRQALEFGVRFARLRTPFIAMSVFTEGAEAVIDVREQWSLGSARRPVLDLFLVGLWRMAPQIVTGRQARSEVRLCFSDPEPDYFRNYREQLPLVQFDQPYNQLRFPVELLDLPLQSADPTTARMMTSQCERELVLLGADSSAGEQVLAVLRDEGLPYPGLDAVAARLGLSARSLKRRLHAEGRSFSVIVEQQQLAAAKRLLAESGLNVAAIAERLGYADPANFTRAFRKWSGTTPSAYRRDQT